MADDLEGVHGAGGRAPPAHPAHVREGRTPERRADRRGVHAFAADRIASPEAAARCGRAPERKERQGGLLLDRQGLPRGVARIGALLHPEVRVSGEHGQFTLLKQRRFLPLFVTQFLGAANDSIFKFAFTLLATYHAAEWGRVDASTAGFVIGALFILPYLLFSATAGQFADKLDKAWIMRRVKDLEIAIMVIAGFAFTWHLAWVLYLCVFLMSVLARIFGPVKYAYLPQLLVKLELTGGNGLVS